MTTAPTNDPKEAEPLARLKSLSAFVGYGTLTARVWFIGPEERLMETADAAIDAHLRVRESFKPVEDCRTAHLEKLKCSSWHGPDAELQSTWGKMSAIMVGLSGGDLTDREACLAYQVSCLGSRCGDTLLSELLPLPKLSLGSWPPIYRRIFGIRKAGDYRGSVLPDRIKQLSGLIAKHKPSVAFCYGKSYRQHFKALFGSAEIKPDRSDEIVQTGTQDGTLIVLTPHFARGFFPKQRVEHVVRLITKARPSLQGELKCCPS